MTFLNIYANMCIFWRKGSVTFSGSLNEICDIIPRSEEFIYDYISPIQKAMWSSPTPFRERNTKANREKACKGANPSLTVRVIESCEHACGLNSDLCLHRPQYSSGRHDGARGPGFMSQLCNFQLSDLNVLGCQEIMPPLQGWWSFLRARTLAKVPLEWKLYSRTV